MSRGLEFFISEVEGLYYLFSENKGADQRRGYSTTDLRLCFRREPHPRFSYDAANIDQDIRLINGDLDGAISIKRLKLSVWKSYNILIDPNF